MSLDPSGRGLGHGRERDQEEELAKRYSTISIDRGRVRAGVAVDVYGCILHMKTVGKNLVLSTHREMLRSHGETEPEPDQDEPDLAPRDGVTLPADPWAGRSTGMRCSSCVWFVPKENDGNPLRSRVGRCRRHAPAVHGFPVVFPTDWCGDHRLDENKL